MAHDSDPSDLQTTLREARRQFSERFDVMAVASSVNGRTFVFRGPLTLLLNPGAYVRINTASGVALLGQVLDREIQDVDASEVIISGQHAELKDQGVSMNEARVRLKSSLVRGSGIVLGAIDAPSSVPPVRGFAEAEIAMATAEDLQASGLIGAPGPTSLEIGQMRAIDSPVPALIDARGFNRHTFLCGQSGSGKTYSLGVVLEQLILHTDLRIAVLDPNADYVHLNEPHASLSGDQTGNTELAAYLQRASALKVFQSERDDAIGSEALRIRFSDLSTQDQARVMRLDPLADREEFDAARRLVLGLNRTDYQLDDVEAAGRADLSESARRVLLRVSNLGAAAWSVWARGDDRPLAEALSGDWRSVVLDVSRFERPIERSVVALSLLRHFWKHRTERNPVLLVIDEAHNVCPREPMDEVQAAATELAISIAGEGRKYGIYLLLATQRPDKLHPNVVSQCDNLILMRMNSVVDLGDLQRIFSFVPPGILAESLAFRQGEALIAGKLATSPTLVRMGRRFSAEGGADVPTDWAIRS